MDNPTVTLPDPSKAKLAFVCNGHVHFLTRELLTLAREWVADCESAEQYSDCDIASISDMALVRGIARHYCGGIAQFIADGSEI